MKVMKKKIRLRVLSLMMLLVMLVTSVPVTSLNAADTGTDPLLQINNEATLETAAIGATIWTDKTYTFTSLPSALIGKQYVMGKYAYTTTEDPNNELYELDVEVLRSGYLYVLTNAYKTTYSEAETLDGLNYTKLDIPGWKFCDFTSNTGYVWVYEKYVEAGESLQLGTWSVVFASDEKLDLTNNGYTVADSEMAVLNPTGDGASVQTMELLAYPFADKTAYQFTDMPYWMAGKNYIMGNYGAGTAEVTRNGVLYMVTNTGKTGGATRESILVEAGFTKVDVPTFIPFTGGSFGSYEFVLYQKTVEAGTTVTWPSWAIPIFSGDFAISDNLAMLEPDGTTTKACKLEYHARLFDNRVFYEMGGTPEPLLGKSFLYSGFDEGATGTVTKAGTLYIQVPVKATSSYTAEAEVIAAGFTPTPYRIYRNNTRLGFCQRIYQKEVEVGEPIHFGKYNLVIYETLENAEDYYVMPSVSTSANIYNNPKVTGPTDAIYTYDPSERNWQGCPSIAVTEGGRLWATWFTGGEDELATGNYAVLVYSDDNGETWVDPAVAVVHPDTAAQVTKPQIWIIPEGNGEYSGKLWCTWTQHTGTSGFDGCMGTWGAICTNPDADNPEDFRWEMLGRLHDGRGSGKVLVIENAEGQTEWLTTAFNWMSDRYYSNVYSSTDYGMTWSLKGKAEVLGSTYNNSVLVERTDENSSKYLWMLTRQLDGRNMVESFSYDGGVTWTSSRPSDIMHPNSDIYMGRTSSGNLLMVNHYMTEQSTKRDMLTAFLSDDGGETWKWSLLLDERDGVSYPSAVNVNSVVEGVDGTIYIVYDYDRFDTGQILMATITEADIMAGSYQSDVARQKVRISSIGIEGPQVTEGLEKIDLSDKMTWASTIGNVAFSAHAAFDGNEATRWCASDGSLPQTLTVDLGAVKDIAQVNIKFELASTWEYTLRISEDGENWSDYDTNPAEIPNQQDYSHVRAAQARYVAIEITNSSNSYWASIFEMSVLDAEGTNLAQNQPCTATSSSGHGNSAPAAFDGNYDTRYCASSETLPQQLMVDLGKSYDIGAIYLFFEQKSNWDYTLETSVDGINWATYAKPGVQRLIDVTETKDAEARYVRLTVNGATTGDWASLWEMEVYAYVNKIDLSDKLTWASTTVDIAASAHAAFDGNEGTRWCASDDSFPQTLTVDLGAVKDIAKVNIKFELTTTWEYTLRISEDGKTWNKYGTNPADIPSQQDYSHDKAAQARYVAIEITNTGLQENGNPYWASIWEMSVLDAGGTNLALNQPCTATSSSNYGASASAAFDGNYGTRYCASSETLPQQLMVDLGEDYDIRSICLHFEQESDWDYILETSLDGVNWETYAQPGAQRLKDVTETKAAEARYARLTVNGTTGGAWASLYEMEVYSYGKETKDETGAQIEFRGGSLRMDSTDYTKTSLRFGYKIYLPEGATLNSWSWQYTTIDPNKFFTGNGVKKTVNADGSINANLVITGIPKSYYGLVLTAKMKIEYTLADGTVCTLEETVARERSVNIVANNILMSQEATQTEKDYATNILQQ